ncbi:hypothetical protein BH11PAT2_BH11PAT2_05520 [soil metagenome]
MILLTETNNQARYWALRALQWRHDFSEVDVQTCGVTMSVTTKGLAPRKDGRKIRLVKLWGDCRATYFQIDCVQVMADDKSWRIDHMYIISGQSGQQLHPGGPALQGCPSL